MVQARRDNPATDQKAKEAEVRRILSLNVGDMFKSSFSQFSIKEKAVNLAEVKALLEKVLRFMITTKIHARGAMATNVPGQDFRMMDDYATVEIARVLLASWRIHDASVTDGKSPKGRIENHFDHLMNEVIREVRTTLKSPVELTFFDRVLVPRFRELFDPKKPPHHFLLDVFTPGDVAYAQWVHETSLLAKAKL
jgi:malate synthase